MAKKRIPMYGIIGIFRAILAHNLVKCEYFLMKPGLLENYDHITYSQQVSSTLKYLKMWFLWSKNSQKTAFISVRDFSKMRVTKTLITFTRNNCFSIIPFAAVSVTELNCPDNEVGGFFI